MYLKEGILKGEIKANQRLQEKEIASLFGTSTTPVREAILKLAGEGFVSIDSHKEAFVKEATYKELKEIYEVIRTLDSFCMKLVVETIPDEKIKEIEKLTERMEKYAKLETLENYLELNSKIHLKIWENVDNKFLRDIVLQIHNQLLRYTSQRISAFYEPGALEKSLNDHKLMVKILWQRDKEKAEKFAKQHWTEKLLPPPF